ncbi:MAG: hypothetical protein VKJ02_04660 [Snowella sp.]|nr:hypothetical protein [Snowella sp.]
MTLLVFPLCVFLCELRGNLNQNESFGEVINNPFKNLTIISPLSQNHYFFYLLLRAAVAFILSTIKTAAIAASRRILVR